MIDVDKSQSTVTTLRVVLPQVVLGEWHSIAFVSCSGSLSDQTSLLTIATCRGLLQIPLLKSFLGKPGFV